MSRTTAWINKLNTYDSVHIIIVLLLLPYEYQLVLCTLFMFCFAMSGIMINNATAEQCANEISERPKFVLNKINENRHALTFHDILTMN